MKFVALIMYCAESDKLRALHAAHRQHLRKYLENGQLFAAGPFAEDGGAMWVLDAESAEAVEAIVKADPYAEAGLIAGWQVRRLAYWSAQEAKGSK